MNDVVAYLPKLDLVASGIMDHTETSDISLLSSLRSLFERDPHSLWEDLLLDGVLSELLLMMQCTVAFYGRRIAAAAAVNAKPDFSGANQGDWTRNPLFI